MLGAKTYGTKIHGAKTYGTKIHGTKSLSRRHLRQQLRMNLGVRMAGAETCNLGASVDDTRLRVLILKWSKNKKDCVCGETGEFVRTGALYSRETLYFLLPYVLCVPKESSSRTAPCTGVPFSLSFFD